jgi:ankyrin repeat protein
MTAPPCASMRSPVTAHGQKGKTALDMAKAQGIKTALSSWQPPPKPPPGPDADSDAGAPLRAATDRGDLAEIIRLIREGADVNAASSVRLWAPPSKSSPIDIHCDIPLPQAQAGFVPLHCACARAVVDCVEELLKRGGNPGALNSTARCRLSLTRTKKTHLPWQQRAWAPSHL